jgi:hypothetical protein
VSKELSDLLAIARRIVKFDLDELTPAFDEIAELRTALEAFPEDEPRRIMPEPPADEPGPDLMACDHLKSELAKMPAGARMQLVMGNDPPDHLAIELCAYGPVGDKFSLVLAIIDLEDEGPEEEDDEA